VRTAEPQTRFPEERPRGPWSIKSRVTEMTEAGSGSTGGSTSSTAFAASVSYRTLAPFLAWSFCACAGRCCKNDVRTAC
jgi:hypothetical protein